MKKSQMKWWVMLAVWLAAAPGAWAGEAKTVKQYETTWTFDKPVQTGQFVNGDWWVVPAAGEDAVTVVSVDPAPVKSTSGMLVKGTMVYPLINGSMVNPMPWFQAFDQRAYQWKGEWGATYPLKLKVNQSLASAVSETEAEALGKDRIKRNYFVNYVAVLTCLGKPPLATDFRPSYVGTEKKLYDSAKMRRDLLPDLPVTSSVKDVPNLKELANARFSRPWVDFLGYWCGYQSKGRYETGYGREKAIDVSGAGLLMCLDKKVVGDKELLLIGLVQTGIDLYGTVTSSGKWLSDGGWKQGRKFPIMFAGLMLDDQEILNVGKKYPASTNTFQEDTASFIVTKADVERKLNVMVHGPAKAAGKNTIGLTGSGFPNGLVMRGNRIKIVEGPGAGQVRMITNDEVGWPRTNALIITCSVAPVWDVVPEVGKSVYQVLGYQEEDIGHGKYGGNHWTDAAGAANDNPSFEQPYGAQNKGSWAGFVLAARILGLKAAWHHDAIFQTVDDFMIDTAPGSPYLKRLYGCPPIWSSGGGSPWPKFGVGCGFIRSMWDTYRSKYGEK